MAAITSQQQQVYHLNSTSNNIKPFGQSNSANLSVTNYNITSTRLNNNNQQQYSSSGSSVSSNNGQQQLPGSWFYEMGPIDDTGSGTASTGIPGDCSPIADFGGEQTAIQHVEVPSSEHVAEIVGRQGCKIKALRNKTGTYIRSPPRGEDPIFTITGRVEDVMEAKREIECAADHFTQIRASRRHSQGGLPAPGHITAYVRVPLRVVGLCVGPKGATIKRIQQNHHVYIITPSREREPIFEVTGLPHNVDAARRDIEQHIFQRTGNMPITDTTSIQNYEIATAALQASRPFGQPVRQMNNCYGDYRNEAAAMYGMRNNYKTYSNSGSPPPPYYDQMNSMYRPAVNNENVFNNGWQQQPNNFNSQCENNYFVGNEYPVSGIQRANNYGPTGTYLNNTTNYLNNLTSSIPQDEGIGESPTNSLTKIGPDHPLRLISSLWNDLDTSDTHDKAPVESGPAPQLATA